MLLCSLLWYVAAYQPVGPALSLVVTWMCCPAGCRAITSPAWFGGAWLRLRMTCTAAFGCSIAAVGKHVLPVASLTNAMQDSPDHLTLRCLGTCILQLADEPVTPLLYVMQAAFCLGSTP